MAYTINLTNGTVFATIADGTINQIASGTPAVPLVTLVGKNYAGYGEFLDENFVHILESGSNSVAPTSPLTGQLWWDSSNNILKIYSGAGFKSITGSTSSASAPTTTVIAGDLWFDSSNQQLKVYTGSAWLVVGPGYTSAQGTSGAIPETILNNVGATKYITSLYVNNVRVGVVFDGASFTPQASLQAAFPTIYPGLTLSSTVSGAVFAGSATNAQLLDSLDSSQFMRTDANTSTTGILRVQNNTGIFVGVSNVFNVNTTSTDANVKSNISGGNLIIQANVAGTTYNVATALGANGTFAVANAATVGTTLAVTGNSSGGNLTTAGQVSATANITGGNIITAALVQGATVSSTANVQAGNLRTVGLISATGNITSAANIAGTYILGNGSQLTGLSLGVSVTKFVNGTTEGNIGVADGNINFNVTGASNVLVLTTGTAYFAGGANVTSVEKGGSNVVGNIGATTGGWFNQAFIAGVNSTTVSASGNVTGGNLITAAAISAASVSASGNITGGNVLGGANVNATTHTGTTVSVTANITGGNVLTSGLISATGNITGGNIAATNHTGTTASVTGNITGGNILTGGLVSATGNVTGNYILGNGALLTGVITSVANINNGTSNVVVVSSGGNVSIGVGGTSNVAVFATTGEYVTGLISASGNITGGNILTGGLISAAGAVTGASLTVSTGNIAGGNINNNNTAGVGNIGTATVGFNTVFALATSAQYADLAERYAADAVLEPGTVVELGGTHEITQSQQDLSDAVFGVISTSPAHLMNAGAGNDTTHPPVAIIGRVPTKVTGAVRKGDRLVSAGNGTARAAQPGEATWFNVIGRALENKDFEELGVIEATVSVK